MSDAVEQARAAAEAARAAADEARRLADEAAARAEELAAALAQAASTAAAPTPADSTAAAPTPAPAPAATPTTAAPTASEVTTPETVAAPSAGTEPPVGPLDADAVEAIRAGYTVTGTVLELGALLNGATLPDVQVRLPLGMLNRHGLVAGATGTGKTRTLQLLAEQIAAAGVPVFAADVKGDLSGLAVAGSGSEKLRARTAGIGQDWAPTASQAEFYSLGGQGTGVPIRATVSGFGPLLLSKVLGLNDTQE